MLPLALIQKPFQIHNQRLSTQNPRPVRVSWTIRRTRIRAIYCQQRFIQLWSWRQRILRARDLRKEVLAYWICDEDKDGE